MKILFITIVILGFLYFMLKKRRFDFFTIGFIASVVYFLPGFYGYTFNPQNYLLKIDLINETYIVMILVLLGIIMGAVLKDIRIKTNYTEKIKNVSFESSPLMLILLMAISTLSFMIILIMQGQYIFQNNKAVIINNLSGYMIIFREASALGLILAFLKNKKKYIVINSLFMIFLIYIGFRSTAAVAIIGLFLIHLYRQGEQRLLLKNLKTIILGSIAALFFFLYKGIYQAIKNKDFTTVFQQLTDFEYYSQSVRYSEPFVTQLILNEVLRSEFTLSYNHFQGVIHNLLFFSSKLGATHISFNEQFQPFLFPFVKFGMADNIWAEMWSVGKWPLLISFIIIFVSILYVATNLLKVKSSEFLTLIILTMTYWSFYIHRNSIVYEIKIIQRVFVIWLIVLIISELISKTFNNKKVRIGGE